MPALQRGAGGGEREGAGGAAAGDAANAVTRIPGGHPEGFLEAFANLYRDFADQIEAFTAQSPTNEIELLVPSVTEGVKGVVFVEKAVASSENGSVWVSMDYRGSAAKEGF